MRALLASFAFLLAGCAELPAFEPESHDTMYVDEPRPGRIMLHQPRMVADGAQMVDDVLVADHVDSFHGDYRLTVDEEGVWCEVEAGPDSGAVGIINICSFRSEAGDELASQTTHDHNFRVLMLPELPMDPFIWDLQIDLVYQEGNTTRQHPHDGIQRLLDLRPELETTLQMDLRAACDRLDPVEDGSGSVPHRLAQLSVMPRNGHAFVALHLDRADVWDVETNGQVVLHDGWLEVIGPFGAPLNATIWIDPEADAAGAGTSSPCGTPLGYHEESFLLLRGVQGIHEGWVEQEITAEDLPVWVTL